jgi:hypothetical protein
MVDSDKAQVIDKLKSEYQEAQLEMKRSFDQQIADKERQWYSLYQCF